MTCSRIAYFLVEETVALGSHPRPFLTLEDPVDLPALIAKRCATLIRRRNAQWEKIQAASRRAERRVGKPRVKVPFQRHPLWEVSPEFDPFHVQKHVDRIAAGIELKIKNHKYRPLPPARLEVRKDAGSYREVNAFAIADEVISQRLFKRLMKKNIAALGGHSYAYRPDLNGYDAVRYVHSQWQERHRIYVAEYDLTGFFDSINHDHLMRQLRRPDVHISPAEIAVIESFLTSSLPVAAAEHGAAAVNPRTRGIPQGTAISCFLANMAMVPLDRDLESLPVDFVRFCDDTLIWGDTYDAVSAAAERFLAWVDAMGVGINHVKSKGVHLVARDELQAPEMPLTRSVSYLGHRVAIGDIRPRGRNLARIKGRINRFIFENLLRAPLEGNQDLTRVSGGKDMDYLVLVLQLRRYLCGNLSPKQVDRLAISRSLPHFALSGEVARLAAVTEESDFRQLDQWVSWQIHLALQKRAKLLTGGLGGVAVPNIWTLAPHELWQPSSPTVIDLSLPRSETMARVVQRTVAQNGSRVVARAVDFYF